MTNIFNIETIGFLAGICVSIAPLLQLIQTWKLKHTDEISTPFIFLNILGQTLWLTYGYFINSLSLIVMSFITLGFSIILMIFKFRFK